MFNSTFLNSYDLIYRRIIRPLLFLQSAETAHRRWIDLLQWLDDHRWTRPVLERIHDLSFENQPVECGGVTLPYPFILAAGMIKSRWLFNIPGLYSLPFLVGPVELGSFTINPRLGNPGKTIWRSRQGQSIRNSVGLKNAGVKMVTEILSTTRHCLPETYGISFAADTPAEVEKGLGWFVDHGVRPAWFTLNLSCPNIPDGAWINQTEDSARGLISAASKVLQSTGIPLWVKVGPMLPIDQYRLLMSICADNHVRAMIATNTFPTSSGGISGEWLHCHALRSVSDLVDEKNRRGYNIDIIGSGGVLDGASYRAFLAAGATAVQYWSAMIYRGPLAAAIMMKESR